MRHVNPARSLVLVMLMVLVTSACGSDEPAAGPVVIETAPNFDTRPIVGTFEVTEGAGTLGCSGGTYGDTFDEATEDVSKIMECSESGAGTFTIVFDPDGYDTGPGEANGPWSIVDGTGDFDGLQGEGDFWLIGDVETYSGDIVHGS